MFEQRDLTKRKIRKVRHELFVQNKLKFSKKITFN